MHIYPMHVPQSRDLQYLRQPYRNALPLFKNIITRALNIFKIVRKRPPIKIMIQD